MTICKFTIDMNNNIDENDDVALIEPPPTPQQKNPLKNGKPYCGVCVCPLRD